VRRSSSLRQRPGLVALLAVISACATPARPPPGAGAADPGSDPTGAVALARFVGAVQQGRWGEAHALLTTRWRASTTPTGLAADYRGAGPVAREAAERVAAQLGAGARPAEDGPGRRRLRTGEGRGARLVAEPGGWRVDALE
jgi:hypothetical protein